MTTLIDTALLDRVSAAAAASPRLRSNHNFHPAADYPAHRLLNAIEPGSYVIPHRHLSAAKDETYVVIRGCLGLVLFDADGKVVATHRLGPGCGVFGVDMPNGTWHSAVSLAPGTVFLESKGGPYVPLSDAERALWAPPEGSPDATAYVAWMTGIFA